ncbi:MAG: META domain-containing protein [Actinomycetia bacterium]|nr:META domain-containing protein [Actinomycetes bacterium]MCP5033237.1 META domain-containing protein [Actinomycetes bacterium]
MRYLRFCVLSLFATTALFLASCGGDDDVIVLSDDHKDGTDTTDGSDTRPSIAGDWQLVSLTVDAVSVDLPAGVDLDITIEDGSIQGLGGCNHFGGSITVEDDGTLHIDEMFSTEMACDVLDFETIYLPALALASQWEASPEGLTFRGEGSEMRYVQLEAAPPLALEETVWTFDTIFDGEGVNRTASTPRLDKPEVTLVIADGQATLTSEDCEVVGFALNYEPGVDGNIAAPDLDGLNVACDDAESNMHAVVEGVLTATGFMINESRLTFIGPPGETVGFIAR